MKKMIVSGWEEEKKKKKKEEERVDNFKIRFKTRRKEKIMMMIKIWFRYTMNNEVFK